MRIYLKYIIIIIYFLLILILAISYIIVSSNRLIDQYKRDFEQLRTEYAAEIKKAFNKIDKLKEQNEKHQRENAQLSEINEKVNKEFNILKTVQSNFEAQSQEFEDIRRKVFYDVRDIRFYVNARLNSTLKSDCANKADLNLLNGNLNERIEILLAEIYNLSMSSGFGERRRRQATELGEQVQKRLGELQNPSNCSEAKKIVCDMSEVCGFGCQMHHILYCFKTAWYTNRTLILNSKGWHYNHAGIEAYFKPISKICKTNNDQPVEWHERNEAKALSISSYLTKQKFLPMTVPKELGEKISRFHGDPFVWWAGQILSYLMRFNDEFEKIVQTAKQELNFSTPCVGVHIRRTDKIGTEAAFHDTSEYMQHVDEFFRLEEIRTGKSSLVRAVYLASDEPKVFAEAQANYSTFRFIYDKKNAETAQLNQRYSPESAKGIILDTYFLSQCDYLVCTLSSTVCRLVYQLMQTRFTDASWRFRSLDDVYFFGGQSARKAVAVFDHKPMRPEEIELRRDDLIDFAGNHWNGYSKGRNLRTNQEGLFPSYKVVNKFQYS